MSTSDRASNFLAWGYKAAIALAFLSLSLSALYLFYFSSMSPLAISGQSMATIVSPENMVAFSAERKMLLLSTAIFIAMSMLFVGFGLFLLQAQGSVDVAMEKATTKVSIARLSPGLFVILCATIIVIVCATHDISYTQRMSSATGPTIHHGIGTADDLLDTNSVSPDPTAP